MGVAAAGSESPNRQAPAPVTAQARRLIERRVRAADVLADLLVRLETKFIFGIPGGPIAPLNDALLDRPSIQNITTRHENGAGFAAAAYARFSGKLGVVLVTSGPGILNAMTSVATAYTDGAPVLFIVGEVARRNMGRNSLQDGSSHGLNIRQMLEPITKLTVEVPTAQALVPTVQRAVATALSGRKGPVAVIVPMDAFEEPVVPQVLSHDVTTTMTLGGEGIATALRSLELSRRGVILVGNGCRGGDTPKALLAVAEKLQWPVMTTPKAKGVFPEDHPLSIGVFGMGGHPTVLQYLRPAVETVLAIGTGLGEVAMGGQAQALRPTRSFIHVDIDASQFGRSGVPTLAISSPADLFLREVGARLRARPPTEMPASKAPTEVSSALVGPQGRIMQPAAVREVQRLMPPDTIWCVDSGEHYFYATQNLKLGLPDAYYVATGLGSMAAGICGAIGVKLACPERPVAVICGDGGVALCAGDIATAVALGLDIAFFVMNDRRLGMVEIGHNGLYKRTPAFGTDPLDIAALGSALGAVSEAVHSVAEIQGAIGRRVVGRPMVFDLQVEAIASRSGPSRVDTLSAHSSQSLSVPAPELN